MNVMNSIKMTIVICLLMISTKTFATETEFGGIGSFLKKDGSKAYALKVFPNTPAAKAGLQDCTQILEINGQNVKKMTFDEMVSIIRGEIGTSVVLLIKDGKEKKEITIIRDKITPPQIKDEKFLIHWKQIAPEGFISMGYLNNSRKYSARLQNEIEIRNYWEQRKEYFKNGYNACLTYPKSDQSACLINLVNREIQKTENQRQVELQQQAIQQQARQNFINTMNQIQTNTNLNNINNSLQMQNMHLQNTNMQLFNINNSINRW